MNKFMLRFYYLFFGSLFLIIIQGKAQSVALNESTRHLSNSDHTMSGFIRNEGQVKTLEGNNATNVYFTFRSSNGVDVYITQKGISYVYKKIVKKENRRSSKRRNSLAVGKDTIYHYEVERVDASLIGADINIMNVTTICKKSSATFNFYDGTIALTDKQIIEKIIFPNIYPGIDWVLYEKEQSSGSSLKYDFVVHRDANATDVKIQYSKNAALLLQADQSLRITSKLGFIVEGVPVVKESLPVTVNKQISYTVSNNIVGFDLKNVNQNEAFTIDPDLSWGTFLHSTTLFDGINWSHVAATDVETDTDGNLYVSLACSGNVNFPTLDPGNGAYYNDIYDSINGANVYMKFDTGGKLLWSTFFANGGVGSQIIADNNGSLIAASVFYASIPYKDNGGYYDTISPAQQYIVRFDRNGKLDWSTRWGLDYESLRFTDIAVDLDNNIYVTGYTLSQGLPKKNPGNGAYFFAGQAYGWHVFVTKFDKQCNLIWSTELQGNDDDDRGTRIAVDKNQNVFLLAQFVRSTNYPLKDAGGFFASEGQSVITKFNKSCQMVWSSYVPGSAADLTTDTSGNIFVVGASVANDRTIANGFPYIDPGNGAYTDPNADTLRKVNAGSIIRFDANTNITWSTTYYGGVMHFFKYVVYEPYRDIIHVYAIMNDFPDPLPALNDNCNGNYFYNSDFHNSLTDPFWISFTGKGKLVYSSFNRFPYAYYDIGEFTVDGKGNLYYVFGDMQQIPAITDRMPLKDPGGGAFFQHGINNSQSYGSFLMKLSPTELGLDTTYTLPVSCNCSGIITVTPVCGSGNYSYQWSRGDTTPVLTNVCPGKYTVIVRDLNSNGVATESFNLPNPYGSVKGAIIDTISAHCNQDNGSLIITKPIGGSAPYNYALNNGNFTASAYFKQLVPGNYIYTIKDKDGCTYSDSVEIINIPGPKTIYTSIENTGCKIPDGIVKVDSIIGGTGSFTYALNNGTSTSYGVFEHLEEGQYSLTATDSAGCSLSTDVTIEKSTAPVSFTSTIEPVHCNQQDGAITITGITGGIAPYMYSLNNVQYTQIPVFLGLTAGTKKIYVEDAKGCVLIDSVFVIENNGPVSAEFTVIDALCGAEVGSLNINRVYDGSAPYYYSIDSSFFTSIPFIDNLLPGSHKLFIKDAYGCLFRDSFSVKFTESLQMKLNTADTVICAGVPYTIIATTNGYNRVQFSWNSGDFQSVDRITKSFYQKEDIIVDAWDNNNCRATDTAHIGIKYCDTLLARCVVFPAAFTPNNDGKNDLFGAITSSCSINNFRLSVYNRWGQLVFQTNDPYKKWNGTFKTASSEAGVYVYINTWTDGTGYTRQLKGTVTLIR